MTLRRKNAKKFRSFDMPVSFKMNESRSDRLRDALNVFSIQARLETRHGRSLLNQVPLPGPVMSLSYFENALGEKFLIAKVGDSIFSINRTGAHTQLKNGLSAHTRHRALTFARGSSSRHIISLEEDGLFQFDGVNFYQLGQAGPEAPSVNPTTGAVADGTYRVALTFYSSKTGFESLQGPLSPNITTTGSGIRISNIPAVAANKSIDTVRIYFKTASSIDQPFYIGEVALGTTVFDIVTTPTGTQVPPLANAMPLAGGGKYLTEFNRCLVYAGNASFANDVFFSEPDLPDAFNDGQADDRKVLFASLDGAVTGLATGLYSNSVLDPFLVIFKKRSTHIYSEINGEGKLIPISREIGCVSHDTIRVKNGVVYFLSEQGWRAIANGQLVTNQFGNPATLADGDIDDIFRSPGYAYEANKVMLEKSFSVYFSTLDQYMTWIAEGGSDEFSKTYVYEFRTGGFKPYQFLTPATAACSGQESAGEVVYMGDADGCIYTHSTYEELADQDKNGKTTEIEAFAAMSWVDGDDLDSTSNFRELILRRLAGVGDLTAHVALNFDFEPSGEYIFKNAQTGFILDISKLDVDAFGTNERSIITTRADINRVGENILITFKQKGIGLNIGLVAAQLEFSRNGNRN